jgi:hypothetical protein
LPGRGVFASVRAAAEAPLAFRGDLRRGRDGFFHVAQNTAGQWWLIAPEGTPRWLKAVHGVRAAAVSPEGGVPRDPAARLREWGFDAVGAGGDDTGRADGLAFLADAECAAAGALLLAPGLRLPDVFDPRWPALVRVHVERRCAPLAAERQLVGWVTDDALAWAQPGAEGRPSLLQLCLSLEPSAAAYHAAWEFVLALHGGRLDALARAWGTPIANKEVVRELTRAELGLATRGYLRRGALDARVCAALFHDDRRGDPRRRSESSRARLPFRGPRRRPGAGGVRVSGDRCRAARLARAARGAARGRAAGARG